MTAIDVPMGRGGDHDPAATYGLERPTLADALESLRRVHLGNVDDQWRRLLDLAGIEGVALDAPISEELLQAMFDADPVIRLIAHALRIRCRSYAHLSTAAEIIRRAS